MRQKEDVMAVVMETLAMKEGQEILLLNDGQGAETLLMRDYQETLAMKDGQEIESLVMKES